MYRRTTAALAGSRGAELLAVLGLEAAVVVEVEVEAKLIR